ncbi:hypothetical protein A1353_08715 [Methylomonas methanica]|uniref:Uncharacterized protein n=1 Tax=Methylomonas methanica TaxID=421 RepID=A0A177ML31_METMH|nr:hypothetical protein A1353_08715 [Methylomonas methanica]
MSNNTQFHASPHGQPSLVDALIFRVLGMHQPNSLDKSSKIHTQARQADNRRPAHKKAVSSNQHHFHPSPD